MKMLPSKLLIAAAILTFQIITLWAWNISNSEKLAHGDQGLFYSNLNPDIQIYDREDEKYKMIVKIAWPVTFISPFLGLFALVYLRKGKTEQASLPKTIRFKPGWV